MTKTTYPTIIQVTSFYPPHLGGMENCVQEISRQLTKDNYSVNIFTSNIGVQAKTDDSKTPPVHRLSSIEFAHTPIIFSLFSRLSKVPKKSIIHVHIAQALTPEIVLLISKLRHIPYITHIHLDVDASGIFGIFLAPYKRLFLTPVLRNAAKVICLSQEQKKEITEKYNLPDKKVIVIPNGVGSEYFLKRSIKDKGHIHILFVGRLVKQKNLSLLINAVSRVKQNIILDIVGDGEERKNLEELVKKLKITNVFFHGEKHGVELLLFYKNADIFAMPSLKEGVSLSLLEAMATGLPVIASDVTGMQDLVSGCGILVKDPNIQSFAQAIKKLAGNTQLRQEFSQHSQSKAKEFSWKKTVMKIEEIYKEVQNDFK